MQFIAGDFYSNYQNILKSKDTKMLKDLITDELSYSIVNDRMNLLKLLRRNNINISPEPEKVKDGEIIDAILENINNPAFKSDIARYIINKHSNEPSINMSGGNMNVSGGESSERYYNAVDPVTAIADGVGSIFKFGTTIAGNKQQKDKAKSELINKVLDIKSGSEAMAQKEKTTKTIIAVFAVITVLGLATFMVISFNKSAASKIPVK